MSGNTSVTIQENNERLLKMAEPDSVLGYANSKIKALETKLFNQSNKKPESQTFKEWFNEDDHDLYNYPEEAMEAAWNQVLKFQECSADDFFKTLHPSFDRIDNRKMFARIMEFLNKEPETQDDNNTSDEWRRLSLVDLGSIEPQLRMAVKLAHGCGRSCRCGGRMRGSGDSR